MTFGDRFEQLCLGALCQALQVQCRSFCLSTKTNSVALLTILQIPQKWNLRRKTEGSTCTTRTEHNVYSNSQLAKRGEENTSTRMPEWHIFSDDDTVYSMNGI